MSADNWAACPKCTTPEEADKQEDNETGHLREDYYIGVHKGKFSISYRSECYKCGFQKEYSYNEDLRKKK